MLDPTILARFPTDDRQANRFPHNLIDYFFERRETVYTKFEVDEYIGSKGGNEDNCFDTVSWKEIEGRNRYMTTHLFFEDLATVS